jgi:pyroglutamyl-peptidase
MLSRPSETGGKLRLLLTGFEPFGGSPVNPSQLAVQALAQDPLRGFELHTAILPVSYERAPGILREELDRVQPQAVICLGEAGRRTALSLERFALNLADAHLPDNTGQQWEDQPVVPDGPAAYFSSLPLKPMQAAVLAAGVPAELSLTAGLYLCNMVFYTLMHACDQRGWDIPAGFIHVPYLPEQTATLFREHPERGLVPSMSLETLVCGLRAALVVLRPSSAA